MHKSGPILDRRFATICHGFLCQIPQYICIRAPRPGVSDAVSKCKSAGVKVAMITGDHPATAKAIAKAVNIITTDDIFLPNSKYPLVNFDGDAKAAVFTGYDLKLMTPEELQFCISTFDELVFSRTDPEQKYTIVKAYQDLGHIVGMTGDGVNDAPALKIADIGIAMGSGTEVAKEVADLILLDDNFSSIVGAIEDGRIIFDNLKKLIRYTMADNVAETYCYIVYAILKIPLPMGTIAMLLSTLGADIFPAISLSHEAAESDIMNLKPRNPKKDNLMNVYTLSYAYASLGVIETCGGFLAYIVTFADQGWLPGHLLFIQSRYESFKSNDLTDSYGQEWTYEQRMMLEKQAQTAFFLAIVISQFANAICCKCRRVSTLKNGMRNKMMNMGLILMIAVPCGFIYTPYLNDILSFVPVKYDGWLAAIPFAVFLFVYDELRRFIVRMEVSSWVTQEFSM